VATQSKAAANDQMRRKMREEWLNKLILNFGDDEGNEANFNGTVVQALMLMNGEEINKAITDREYGTVAHVLKQRGITRDSIAYLFLAALNRPPTEAEYRRLLDPQMRMLLGVRSPRTPQETVESYVAFYQDLFWAILNSSEFFLNH
jgi:3-oxoacyl-[acyl-carrier-protein] synthase III